MATDKEFILSNHHHGRHLLIYTFIVEINSDAYLTKVAISFFSLLLYDLFRAIMAQRSVDRKIERNRNGKKLMNECKAK